MEKQIIALAKKAIAIKSIAGNKDKLREIIDLFVGQFNNDSLFEIKHFSNDGVLSVTVKPRFKQPKIWLNAHLDVVPADDHLFTPRIFENKLYGRGALDMKTAAAAFALLTKRLIEKGKNVGLMLVTDEEIGGHRGTKFLIEKNAVKPEFVIVGEPTNMEIGIESKGIITLEIISSGKTAHGSRPWLGENAIVAMIGPISQLLKAFPIPNREAWRTTVNLGIIQAGLAVNQVPDKCTIKLDVRNISKDDPKIIIKKIKNIFNKQNVCVKMLESPIFSDHENPYIKNFARVLRSVLKRKAVFLKGHGSSDIRFFTEKEIPAIAFGLTGEGLHSNDEWVSLESVGKLKKVLENYL